jgi:HPt (histidine-containing phosphotransfer) domain-containing protein
MTSDLNAQDDENIVIDIPGVDTEIGLLLCGDELDIYLLGLRSYVANTPEVLNKLRNVSGATLPDYVITVHGMKGISANIGAEKTREKALALETMARQGDLDGVLAMNDQFIKNTENIIANIKKWLDQYDSNH